MSDSTKERGGLTHEGFLGLWRAYLGLKRQNGMLREALEAICQTNDSGPWIAVYRHAGGGYEGLQAIAEAALEGTE